MRKYKELSSCSFLIDEDHYLYDVKESTETIHLFIKSALHSSHCPECGIPCSKLHATYVRTIQDTPIHGKQTILHVVAYKYECLNPDCSCQVFSEPLPFVRPSQVRTDALNTFILGIAIFLSNECASKILDLLGVSASDDTIQRLHDRLEFVDDPEIEAVGIDDVAIRKGQSYATAIYDFNDHHLIALLEGRNAKTLKEWLLHHPKINLVTRDRANAYAKAITDVLPECVQVADRFHLLQNLIERLKDIFKAELPETFFVRDGVLLDQEPEKIYIEKTPNSTYLSSLHYDNSIPKNSDGSERIFDNKKHDLTSSQYKKQTQNRKAKQQLIREIQADWAQNIDVIACAQKFHIHPNTLKKYLKMTPEEITQMDHPKNYKKRTTVMDNYLNMIFKMMQDGLSDETIYFYLRDQGCDKNSNTIWDYLQKISKNNFPSRNRMSHKRLFEKHYPPEVTVIKRTPLLKYILTVNPKTKKDEQLSEILPLIKERYPIVLEVETIFKEFHSLLIGDSPDELDPFIETYQNSLITSFCQTLKKDIAPVKNAISLKASSGFVEGNNNKFKLIKRIVYGRSGLVNLSKKCQLAFSATLEDFSLQDLL